MTKFRESSHGLRCPIGGGFWVSVPEEGIATNVDESGNPICTCSPWNDALTFARCLEQAVNDCGWRHGSAHSDWDEIGKKWSALHDLTKQTITELEALLKMRAE